MFASTVSQCFYQQFIVSRVMENLFEGFTVNYTTISLLIWMNNKTFSLLICPESLNIFWIIFCVSETASTMKPA